MDRPVIRQTFSSETAQSTQVGDNDEKSNTPLETSSISPPPPSDLMPPGPNKPVRIPAPVVYQSHPGYDAERGGYEGMPYDSSSPSTSPIRPNGNGRSSWKILDDIKKFEDEVDQFDTRYASDEHRAYAAGDVPTDKVNATCH
jgi:hypothetical protein